MPDYVSLWPRRSQTPGLSIGSARSLLFRHMKHELLELASLVGRAADFWLAPSIPGLLKPYAGPLPHLLRDQLRLISSWSDRANRDNFQRTSADCDAFTIWVFRLAA